MSSRQQLQVTLTLAGKLQVQSKDWADFGWPVHKDKPNNEGLNSTTWVACTHCLLSMHKEVPGNMAYAANLVISGDAHHLSTELLVGGSKVVLQLLLQVL